MTGILAVVVGFGVLLGVSVLASSGDVDIRLGDERFPVGQTERLASRIAEDRRPFLFSDVSGSGTRDIYLQHLGETPEVGWLAFAARAPGQSDRSCVLEWDLAEQELLDPCDGTRYPGDGTGLTRYPVEVDEGQLYVDLRSPKTTTTAP